ncbi:MAG TPA: flagellar basal body protein FliL [Rhodospirillaceae bacterium]|nr:flagellar basal body protein FliL [Candidatus Neomarinimicrobiota bacterium]HCX13884.1 flagellar basal body protein FliL [Rhodospirillaceae bacterium]
MAEEDFEDEEIEYGGGDGSRQRTLLMVVLPIVVVVGGGAVAYFTGMTDPLISMVSGGDAEEQSVESDLADIAVEQDVKPVVNPGGTAMSLFYDLPEMLVNINTAGRAKNFLKIRVSLELANEADINQVDTVLPRIIDNFQVYLRELRLEDLQGAAGMYRLREELLNRVNAAVRPAQVKDVLFKEMVVQ